MSARKTFDWPALMRAGMAGLRLTPEQFWALTPAELALMLGVEDGQKPLRRDALKALMEAFPDHGVRCPKGDER